MPLLRDRYTSFGYLISLGTTVVGGFSEMSEPGVGLTITLRRGASGMALTEWLRAARDGTAQARHITITRVDAARRPVATWMVRGAVPTKFEAAALNAEGNEVPIDEIQLTAEGIEPAS